MQQTGEKRFVFARDMCGSPWLLFLLVIYVTFTLLGTILLYKLVVIGPGLAPGGLFVLPFVLLIEDVVAEVYGYKISRLLLWFVLASIFIFAVFGLVIIHLPSPVYWHFQQDFDMVFDPIIAGAPAIIVALTVGRFANIYVITRLKVLTRGRFFWVRGILATTVGGLLSIIIGFGLGYCVRGIPFVGLEKLVLTDYLVRFFYAVFGGGPAWLLVIYLKKKEKIDVYDIGTNFNPFKFTLED